MFGGGETGRGFFGVDQVGNAEDHCAGRFFKAETGSALDARLAQTTSETEEAREGANDDLLFFGKFCEAVFLPGFGAAVKAHRPSHQIPFFGGPVGRNG